MPNPKNAEGLTLIEAILTLALLSILAGFAVASWTQIAASTRHTELVNGIHRTFAIARSHAVHQKTLTTICPLSAEGECIDDWNLPVSIFPDSNNNKRPDGGNVNRVVNLSSNQSALFSRTAGRGYFQLAPNGMSHGTMGSIIACSSTGSGRVKMSYLALNIGGRLRTLHDENDDGKIVLPWGAEISCPSP
ncbi:MAG: GspH/FimT family pseudopilin [Marinobacter adhaerens]